MMATTTHVKTIPPITRKEARHLATTEYARLVEQLRMLSPSDWEKPTECPMWDVRAMAGHSLGMMSDFTSLRSVMRRMSAATKTAKKTGQPLVDAMTAMQVADNASLSTDDLISRIAEIGPRAARWRTRANKVLRSMPMKEEVAGKPETWRMSYLFDTILTRDPWMHRVDISQATGHELMLTTDHDARIIADVVAEWARRHGKPFTLTLTGPVGGEFVGGEFVAGDSQGEQITIDAVEFCRVLSNRAQGQGLLTQEVPF